MGLRPLFDDHCAQLAHDHGFTVCAFELFPGREELTLDERLEAGSTLDDDHVLGDALAAAAMTECDRAVAVGFCMGGMYALKSVSTRRFERVAAFYGQIRLPEQWRGPGQREPLELMAEGDPTTVLEIIGTADGFTPPDDVLALEATGARTVKYAGAEHGFVHDASRETHRRADAADAWAIVIAWLKGL
jgi:carboxymethylenebutenolidase